MFAAFKILAGVAAYRLKKLEMANMFAAVSIMMAIRLPLGEILYRSGFGILLNLLVYLINDYCDVEQDLVSPFKDRKKTEYLKSHKRAALSAQLGLTVLMIAIGFAWRPDLVAVLAAGAGICWFYSWRLKRIPYLDVLAMTLWGAAMPMIGFPLDNIIGWCLVVQLALFSACFESIQIVRDYDEDVASGIRTTAVLLGVERTILLTRIFIFISAVYAALVLNRWFGFCLFAALAFAVEKGKTETYWNRIRLIFGLAWLAMIGWIYWYGSSAGLIAVVDVRDVLFHR